MLRVMAMTGAHASKRAIVGSGECHCRLVFVIPFICITCAFNVKLEASTIAYVRETCKRSERTSNV